MTPDFAHPLSQRALTELAQGKTEVNLLRYATMLTGSLAKGQDLMQQARLIVCDPVPATGGRPWDPGRGSFSAHMRLLLLDLARQARRTAQARREVLDAGIAADAAAGDADARPDEALQRERTTARARRLGGVLRARLVELAGKGKSDLALRVFDRRCRDDEESAEDLAIALGCTVKEVYDANRQIAYHAAKVRDEDDQAEERRMNELRERAMATRGRAPAHEEERE